MTLDDQPGSERARTTAPPRRQPEPERRHAQSRKTSVLVASGESIVLGGLIRENNDPARSGHPAAFEDPGAGRAFRLPELSSATAPSWS